MRYRWLRQKRCALLVVISFIAPFAQQVAAERYRFVLTKGAEEPVCKAYVQRLNRTDFEAPPYCDRPENSDVKGFATLNRVVLDIDEIEKLNSQVYGFLWERDARYVHPPAGQRDRWRANLELQIQHSTSLQRHFRFEPPIDIDNDGVPDQLVIWRETGYRCGEVLGAGPARASTFVIVLDAQGNVDAARTQEIFGHPAGGYVVTYRDAQKNAITKESKRFRPIGRSLSVFVFEGRSYFDTFYDDWGDLTNHRRDDPQIMNTLAVLKRESGKTDPVCEIRWNEQKKK